MSAGSTDNRVIYGLLTVLIGLMAWLGDKVVDIQGVLDDRLDIAMVTIAVYDERLKQLEKVCREK